jgi:hypothetical protein
MTAGYITYEITIYCRECHRMVYEERGVGGDNYERLLAEAHEALNNRLEQAHLHHHLHLRSRAKVPGYP